VRPWLLDGIRVRMQSMLQYDACVAVCCGGLLCTAVGCCVLQLQCAAMCCGVLQRLIYRANPELGLGTTLCSTLQHTALYCSIFQHAATQHRQCVAVWCSVAV